MNASVLIELAAVANNNSERLKGMKKSAEATCWRRFSEVLLELARSDNGGSISNA